MNWLIVLLLTSQFAILPYISFRWIKEVSVQVFIILTICSLIWQKNKPIALFVGYCIFLFFYTKSFAVFDTKLTDVGIQDVYRINLIAFFNIINIVLYGLFYYVLHQMKFNRDKIFKTLCFIAIFQSCYVVVQGLNVDQFFYHLSGVYGHKYKISWPVGLWGNEALCSWCIALCSPFFLKYKDLKFKIGYGICFVALLILKCSAGLVGFGVGFLFWLFFKKRKWAIAILTCCLVGGAVFIGSGRATEYLNPTHRFQVWKKAIQVWQAGTGDNKLLDRKTVTGYGHGSFRTIFVERAPEFRKDGHWAQAHNEYIQILFEQGIIGFSFIAALMWITFLRFWRTRRGLVPITSLVILSWLCIFGFPMRTAMGVIPIFALVMFEKEFYGRET